MATGLTSATISVSANTRQMEKDIAKALKTIELSQIDTKKSSQALGRITGQVSEFNKSLEASNARVIAFGASAGTIFAVEKALSSLVSSTIEVEKKLTDINVLLNLSSSGLQKFGGSLFDIAKNTAQSFSSVAEAATELARQGLGVEETLKRTNAALVLARLSGLDTVKSVEALTATLNSFSGSALDAVQVVNKLANVDAAFAVSSADLASAISRVGSTAQDAGVSLDELISIVTAAQQTTARGGAVIGNSLKTIFTRLQRGKVQDLLGSLGVDTSEGQSAIDLLKQLASTYDTLGAKQKSYVAEQVGGVFQINILKAALSDLGKEYSVYDRALATSLSSTDQAIKRNQELNKTISALSSQAVSNLEQAASKIGSIVFEPNAKNFLSSFNGIIESFNGIDSESQGGKFIEGFFKGISNFIGGPGTVLAVAVLTKLFVNLTKFAAGSAKELLGRNEATKQQAALEQSVLSILQKNSVFTEKILSGKMTTVQAEKQLLDYLTAQSNVMREQERISKVIAGNLGRAGVSVGASGVPLTSATGKKTFSSGFVPNFASDRSVGQAMENAGAKEHGYKAGNARKTRIHDGNGKSFSSFVNSKEDVKTFTNAAGKKATVVRPPNGFGENTQYAAGGFVPNFIKELDYKTTDGDSTLNKTDSRAGRLMYVDAVESNQRYGPEAAKLAEKILYSSFKNAKDLEKSYPGKAAYDRYSFLSEKLSSSLIESGMGVPDIRYSGSLYDSETMRAMNRGVGIWNSKNKRNGFFVHPKAQQFIKQKNLDKALPKDLPDNKRKFRLGSSSGHGTGKYAGQLLPEVYKTTGNKVKFERPNFADGFIPNFASMGSKFKAMYGGGTTMRAVDKEKTAKKKNLDVKKLDLSDRYTMVHGGNQGLDSANVSLEAGNKLFDAKIATAGLDTAGTNLQRYGIKGVVGDALVGATNNIIKTFGGTEQITDASSLDNAGSVGSAAGTVFETALRKAFNAPAVSQTQRIDFPAPTPELKKFFHNAPGQYEAKISRTPDNLKSTLKKWVDVNGLASSASGYVPNFAKSGLSFSHKDKDEFGFSEIQAIMSGKRVGSFSYAEDKKGLVDVGDFSVNKGERGKGIGTELYKEAIRRNKGKKMKGQLLPQMNRLLQKIKNGEPVSAETLYPQIKRADLAKSSLFEVYGHKGMEVEKMTRDQFSSFVNAKINELKKDPKKLQSFFGNVEADEYGGLGVDLQTQHASGFIPNFARGPKGGSDKLHKGYIFPDGEIFNGLDHADAWDDIPAGRKGAIKYVAPFGGKQVTLQGKLNKSIADTFGKFGVDPTNIRYGSVDDEMRASNEAAISSKLSSIANDFVDVGGGYKARFRKLGGEPLYTHFKSPDGSFYEIQGGIPPNDIKYYGGFENLTSDRLVQKISSDKVLGLTEQLKGEKALLASGYVPNFADQVRKNMYDWDGTIIPTIRGNADEYIKQLALLKEKDLLPIGKKLKSGKKKFDILTSRPPLFEKAISETSSRLGLPVNKINFGVKPKDKLVEAGKRGSKIVDDNLDLIGKPGFLNARVVNKRLSSGFVPNFSNALNDAIAREQSSGLSKSQIYVDRHSSLKNKNNPMGLMVANRRDEPGGGIQGINRAKKEGRNPKTYGGGMSSGFIPNFASMGESEDSSSSFASVIAGLQGIAFTAVFLGREMRDAANNIKVAKKDIEDFGKTIQDTEDKTGNLEKRKSRLQKAAPNLTSTEILEASDQLSEALRLEAETIKTGNAKDVNAARQMVVEAQKKLTNEENALASKIKQRISSIDQSINSNRQLVIEQKKEMAERQKAVKQMKSQKMTNMASQLGMVAQVVAPQVASFIPQDTQNGRGAAASVEGLGNIAGMAGTGAMIGGPWGAAAGAAIGALLEIPKIEKAFTSKMPELEKAVTAATEGFTKFSDSGQQFLNSSQKLAEIRVNPNSSEGDIIAAEKQYIDTLAAMPKKYQEQLVAAERLGNAQKVYSEILEQLSIDKGEKEASASARQVYEKNKTGLLGNIGDQSTLIGIEALKQANFLSGGITSGFSKQTSDYSAGQSRVMLENQYGDLTSTQDIKSIVADSYKYTRVSNDPNTDINEASAASAELGSSLEDIQKRISDAGGSGFGNFEGFRSELINSLKTSFTKSGGELTSGEGQYLENLSNAISRPDQLQQWLQEYQSANNNFISGQEKIEEVRKNIAERQKKEAEKRNQDRQRADRSGARVSSAKSEVDQLFSNFQYAMEEGLSKVKFAGDLEGNRGNFAKEIYDLTNMPNASRRRDENNKVFSIEQTRRQETEHAKTTGASSIFESIGNIIDSASLDESVTSSMNDSEKRAAASEFELKKTELKNELIGSGAMNQVLQGDTAGAKGTLDALIEKMIASGSFTATQIQDLKNKTVKELDSVDKGIKTSNRNELQQKALLAQQLAFDRAREKITQAQNLGGGAEEIIPNLLGAEDSLINQIKDSMSKTVGGGYNANNLVKDQNGKIIDKNTGKAPALDSLGALTDTLSKLTKFTGAPITSMGDMNFQAISQGYNQMLTQSIDDLEKQSGGALGPDVFKRMRDQVSSLGTDKEGGASVASNLQLMQKLGVIDSSQYVDQVTGDYTKKEFENLPKELQDAYKGVTGDSKLQFLGINELTKVSSNGFGSVVEAINTSFDAAKISEGIKQGLVAAQVSERKIAAQEGKADAMSNLEDAKTELGMKQENLTSAKGKFDKILKDASGKELNDMEVQAMSQDSFWQNPEIVSSWSDRYSEKNVQEARSQVATGYNLDGNKKFLAKAETYNNAKAARDEINQAQISVSGAEANVQKSSGKANAAMALVGAYDSQVTGSDQSALDKMTQINSQNKEMASKGYYTPGKNYLNPALSSVPKPQAPVNNPINDAMAGFSPTNQAMAGLKPMGQSSAQSNLSTNVGSINVPFSINIQQQAGAPQEAQQAQVQNANQLAEGLKNQIQELAQKMASMNAELQKNGSIKPPPPTNPNIK